MTALTRDANLELNPHSEIPSARPRFGGLFRRLSGRSNGFAAPLAGRAWNPVFALVLHRGRRSGREYRTPVAARRVPDGFVISLAFGAHVDWYRNLLAAGGGAIRWRGNDYEVTRPETIDVESGRAAFHPIQRLFLWLAGIGGYIRVRDVAFHAR